MPSSYPQTYAEASAMIVPQFAQVVVSPATTMRRAGDAIVVSFEDQELVTFRADGRVKLCTLGRNDRPTVTRLNRFLPPCYRVYKRGPSLQLIDTRQPRKPVASFLTSTIFLPIADASPDEFSAPRRGNRAGFAVEQYDQAGNLLATFPTAYVAAASTGVSRVNLARVARSGKGTAGGFVWKYAKHDEREAA